MNVRDVIKSPKSITDSGVWADGTMRKSAFPLSKSGSKAYRLGNRRWRVVRFEAHGMAFRLLINYHPMLLQYQAILGAEVGGDTRVLAFLEHHPSHKSWHVHVCCDSIESVPLGIKRGPWFKNMGGCGPKHHMEAPTSDDTAFTRAVSFFRLDKRDAGLRV